MTDINTIISGITTAFDLTKRLKEISKNIADAEFSNLLADLSNKLVDTKLEVVGLKTKIYELEEDNLKLKTLNKNIIESQKVQTSTIQNTNLSEYAIAILKKCKEKDIIKFNDVYLSRELSLKNVEFETGLGELYRISFIRRGSVRSFGEGAEYRITQPGKEYMLKL
ncbi:MAG: hypothetical protein KAI43_06150 [Candidatus Aureabacteria bacterium]|nr:hypothetical protein [Candidatus Auribacterota bacterium]